MGTSKQKLAINSRFNSNSNSKSKSSSSSNSGSHFSFIPNFELKFLASFNSNSKSMAEKVADMGVQSITDTLKEKFLFLHKLFSETYEV